MCLAQEHNEVRLKPAAPQSRVKCSQQPRWNKQLKVQSFGILWLYHRALIEMVCLINVNILIIVQIKSC